MLVLALAGVACAQTPPRYTLDASGSRVVALSNLSSNPECLPAQGTGRVVGRRMGRDGRTLAGITFQDDRFGRSFLNIAPIAPPPDPTARQWIARGMEELFRDGQRLTLGIRGCGASASVQYVESAALIGVAGASPSAGPTAKPAAAPPNAPAPAEPGAWTFGPHPVLGLSAHVAVGNEAIGFACSNPVYDGGRQDFLALRMTPGFVPSYVADVSPFWVFEGANEANGGGFPFQRRGGYLENNERMYCELSGWQRSSAALLLPGTVTGVDPQGVTLQQGDRLFRIRPGSVPSGLRDVVRIPLTGSGQAIRQILNACPSARRALQQGCGVD